MIIYKDLYLIYYFSDEEVSLLTKNIFSNHKKKGIYIFQYIEKDLMKKNKKNKFVNFDLNLVKNYKEAKFSEKNNPVRFLKFKNLLKLIKEKWFKYKV